MAYDQDKAGPTQGAHDAAASLDAVYEAVSDGIDFSDLSALFKLKEFLGYVIVPDKGMMISRMLQVISLVERDNSIAEYFISDDE